MAQKNLIEFTENMVLNSNTFQDSSARKMPKKVLLEKLRKELECAHLYPSCCFGRMRAMLHAPQLILFFNMAGSILFLNMSCCCTSEEGGRQS